MPAADEATLYLLLRYHLGWGDRLGRPEENSATQGKSMRSTLCLFSCEALTNDFTRALPAAAALEIIHNFSLIHDDIQDQDLERRHQSTVWNIWGVPKALVAGNAMQSVGDLALLNLAQNGTHPESVLKVSQLLTSSYLEMIEGQCLDLAFESRTKIATSEYLQMIAYKTGALIQSGLEIGALLATSNPGPVAAFSGFGRGLGRAFQIRDDFLGIWGDEATTGKATGNDIRRRKKSLPVVFALEQAGGSNLDDLFTIYSQDDLSEDDVERVLEVLDDVGAQAYCQDLTEASAEAALDSLYAISLPAWVMDEAKGLVDFLARRLY